MSTEPCDHPAVLIPYKLLTIAFIVGLVVGHFSLHPSSITKEAETVTKTNENKKVDTVSDVDQHRHMVTTTTEMDKPDGTKVKVTQVTDDTNTDNKTKTDDVDKTVSSVDAKSKEVIKYSSGVSFNVMYGAPLSLTSGLGTPVYGVAASKTILGPFSIGAFGFTSGLAGVSVGLSF